MRVWTVRLRTVQLMIDYKLLREFPSTFFFPGKAKVLPIASLNIPYVSVHVLLQSAKKSHTEKVYHSFLGAWWKGTVAKRKFQKEKFEPDMQKILHSECHRLPQEAVDSASSEIFITCMGSALRDIFVFEASLSFRRRFELNNLQMFLQTYL